mmetsp:Transcript_32317/g.91630  ORF Transcript_32317/g.91630 Transcript_32317/m.91630 type:complete len:181 (-) Transcript_32317:228-770(-)|eukprot:CAMPEP_0117663624 /NCGR_PEP_ID=MMETSP0804-20121206/8727_1 /TAXON_ID=1074897 /ORGANISM="Tetraselmis astigmatica, Strain CCMP880" /LENGTH=180 /DNA_ID=CAMNT_0005470685 /DNA_START=188 /DNA_END=730 /DNA_ORIENTATION=-
MFSAFIHSLSLLRTDPPVVSFNAVYFPVSLHIYLDPGSYPSASHPRGLRPPILPPQLAYGGSPPPPPFPLAGLHSFLIIYLASLTSSSPTGPCVLPHAVKPDFPNRMYTTGAVMDPFDGCVENVRNGHVKNNLDSAPGQSGSPIWDASGYIRAILVNSLPGARTVTYYSYNKILNWMLYT